MPAQPRLVLHVVPFSHPCLAVSAALDRLGQEYETVTLETGRQGDEVEKVYGEGRRTVPGLLVDDEPVHGTSTIFARLDELRPDAGLYPAASAEEIRAAEAGIAEAMRASWRYLDITAQRAYDTLQALPAQLDTVDALLDSGALGGEEPTAADFQLGSSLHLLVQIGDLRPLVEERPAWKVVSTLFEPGKGNVSAGAFPPGWVPPTRS